MSENLLKKFKERKTKKITLLGEDVLVKQHSMTQMEKILEMKEDEDKAILFLANQFLDVKTKEPFFSKEYLKEEMSNVDLKGLLMSFIRHNSSMDVNLEEIEKN